MAVARVPYVASNEPQPPGEHVNHPPPESRPREQALVSMLSGHQMAPSNSSDHLVTGEHARGATTVVMGDLDRRLAVRPVPTCPQLLVHVGVLA